ncbi:hypothetical protein KC19_VG335500 [Ceratodon purpureus]|uniref:Uncharacterized protein n=1 Tax=Ceratodon purpureus TaxID=3225 RepID=A0A8T0HW41_CERPU|nr:hypothetical protein KC19_VG335500 [Ceratodon purpureus]
MRFGEEDGRERSVSVSVCESELRCFVWGWLTERRACELSWLFFLGLSILPPSSGAISALAGRAAPPGGESPRHPGPIPCSWSPRPAERAVETSSTSSDSHPLVLVILSRGGLSRFAPACRGAPVLGCFCRGKLRTGLA